MPGDTGIRWCSKCWSFLKGCSKISPGCEFCYAEEVCTGRLVEAQPELYADGFAPRFRLKFLDWPLHLGQNALVFVTSLSDPFHEAFPEAAVIAMFEVMRLCPWIVFMLLTKRPERMAEMVKGPLAKYASLPNTWWGVSVENRQHGLPRIEALRSLPVPKRWISFEPLLEDLGVLDLGGVEFAVIGGESGIHLHNPTTCARRGLVHKVGKLWLPRSECIGWVRSIRDQCQAQGVATFFKQWGGPTTNAGGCELDGRMWNEYPPFRFEPVPPLDERRRRIRVIAKLRRDLNLDAIEEAMKIEAVCTVGGSCEV